MEGESETKVEHQEETGNKGIDETTVFQLPSLQPFNQFSFQFLKEGLECIEKSLEIREQLLQYNLTTSDKSNLHFYTFRFHGLINPHLQSDYETLFLEMFSQPEILATLGFSGQPTIPLKMELSPLTFNVLSLDFFDRLYQSAAVTPEGRIRGCFDETFDGVTVGDLLREMMVNENSENSYVFQESEKKELIYQLFRTFVIGGQLCQPETHIDRYLSLTKSIYKDLVTVYKDSKTQEVKVSGKAFELQALAGVELFTGRHNPMFSHLYLLVEPLKKNIVVVKNTFNDFW